VLLAACVLSQGCAAYGGAAKAEGADAAAIVSRAQALMAAHDYEAARSLLLSKWQAQSRDPALAMRLAECELLTSRAAPAAQRLEVALVWHENDARLLFWLSAAQAAAGAEMEAREALSRALEAAGEDETALYDLAEEFLRRGVPSVSGAIYEKILSVYPRESQFDIFSCLQLSALHYANEDYAAAAAVMKRAAEPMEFGDVSVLAPQESRYWISIFEAMHQIRTGALEEGITRLRNAAAEFPTGVAADAVLVSVLDEEGRGDEAAGVFALSRRRLRDAVNAEPEEARRYHEAALLAALSGRALEDGLRYCEWALVLKPLMAEFMDTKAALLLQLDRPQEALACSERAMALATAARWGPPATAMTFALRRLEALRGTGVEVPEAFTRLP